MMAAPQRPPAFRHELVLHSGPAELLEMMVPFARDGSAAGEPVVVLGELDFVDAMRSAVPDVQLRVLARPPGERFPARELHEAERVLARLDRSRQKVRIINQMPAMTRWGWLGWRRYEAAANVALAPYRAWGKCAHDLAHLDPGIVAELRAGHPFVQTTAGHGRNPDFDGAGTRTHRFLDVPRHPVEDTEPTLSIVDPTAALGRRAVRDLAVRLGLSPTAQECVVLATSEAVTNAWVHGRPPVLLRMWAGDGRVTVAVTDVGTGPHPLVGMLAKPPDSPSGRGMWMVHLLVPEVHHRRGADGYTITFAVDRDVDRLTA